jgi:hypothetical protein
MEVDFGFNAYSALFNKFKRINADVNNYKCNRFIIVGHYIMRAFQKISKHVLRDGASKRCHDIYTHYSEMYTRGEVKKITSEYKKMDIALKKFIEDETASNNPLEKYFKDGFVDSDAIMPILDMYISILIGRYYAGMYYYKKSGVENFTTENTTAEQHLYRFVITITTYYLLMENLSDRTKPLDQVVAVLRGCNTLKCTMQNDAQNRGSISPINDNSLELWKNRALRAEEDTRRIIMMYLAREKEFERISNDTVMRLREEVPTRPAMLPQPRSQCRIGYEQDYDWSSYDEPRGKRKRSEESSSSNGIVSTSHDSDRQHEPRRSAERMHTRDRSRDHDRDRSRDHDRDRSRDYDHDRSRDRDRDHSRDRDRDHSRDYDRKRVHDCNRDRDNDRARHQMQHQMQHQMHLQMRHQNAPKSDRAPPVKRRRTDYDAPQDENTQVPYDFTASLAVFISSDTRVVKY